MKYDRDYWLCQIEEAQDCRKEFYKYARESISEYCGGSSLNLEKSQSISNVEDVSRRINCWWSLINTILPAYFSRPPEVEAEVRKKEGDKNAQALAVILQRALQFLLEEQLDIRQKGLTFVLNWLQTGEANFWIGADEKGIKLDVLHYEDYLESICRNVDNIEWKAKRVWLTKEETEKYFGQEAEKLTYTTGSDKIQNVYKQQKEEDYEDKCEVWEIVCKQSKKVYYVSPGSDFYVAKELVIYYLGCYPNVNLKANSTVNYNVPFGDYIIARDQIVEIERLTTRIHGTLRAIRSNFFYNEKLGKEIANFFDEDLKGIPAKSDIFVNNPTGTLDGHVLFFPIEKYTQALQALIESRNEAFNRLYEIIPASELIRGVSDPVKTATANRLESNYSNLRFSLRQEQLTYAFNELIQILAQTLPKVYSFEKILEISNASEIYANEFQNGALNLMEIAQLYQNLDLQNYKINVGADSLIELDEIGNREDRLALLETAGKYMQQIEGIVTRYPSLAPALFEVFTFAIRSFNVGKSQEAGLQQSLVTMVQELQQQKQNAPEPPPDPALIDSQNRLQIAQMQIQAEQQKQQVEMQRVQYQAQVDMQQLQATEETKRLELQVKLEGYALEREEIKLEFYKLSGDARLADLEFERDTAKLEGDLTKEIIDTEQAKIKAKAEVAKGMLQNGKSNL